MPTMETLTRRLETHRTKTKAPKDPRYWPFCICCHLAAPEAAPQEIVTSYESGPQPNLLYWGELILPAKKPGEKEKFNLCPDCSAFQVTQLVRYHKACKSKLEKISESLQKRDKCGLRLKDNINPFKSAFCSQPKGHLDACR